MLKNENKHLFIYYTPLKMNQNESYENIEITSKQ